MCWKRNGRNKENNDSSALSKQYCLIGTKIVNLFFLIFRPCCKRRIKPTISQVLSCFALQRYDIFTWRTHSVLALLVIFDYKQHYSIYWWLWKRLFKFSQRGIWLYDELLRCFSSSFLSPSDLNSILSIFRHHSS